MATMGEEPNRTGQPGEPVPDRHLPGEDTEQHAPVIAEFRAAGHPGLDLETLLT